MADNDKGQGSGFLAGLLLGGAIGALIAILFAPNRGEDTRDLLLSKKDEYAEILHVILLWIVTA